MRAWHDSALTWVAITLLSSFSIPSWSQIPPLKLISASPANNAIDVSRTVTPTLNFSTTLNRASVSPSRVTMSAPSGVQPLNFGVTDNQLTLLPRNKLLPITKYTLNVSGVRGINGEALAAPVNTAFITRDGAWQGADLITHPSGVVGTPVVATNESGVIFVTWLQNNTNNNALTPWSTRYLPGLGWSKPVPLEPAQPNNAEQPRIAVDHQGNALVLWTRNIAGRWSLWANHYTRGVGWGTAEVIVEDSAGSLTEQQIAFDANDNAFVVWEQHNSSVGQYDYNIYAVRYSATGGWGTPEQIDSHPQSVYIYGPRIGLDAQGNAMAMWTCIPDNIVSQLCANRYTAGVGWGTVTSIATASLNNNNERILESRLAVSALGTVFAVWSQGSTASHASSVYARRYTDATGWEATTLAGPDIAYGLQLAASATGDAIIAYTRRIDTPTPQNYTAGHFVVYGNHFSASSGWQSARLLQANESYDSADPRVVMDATGNGIVSWSGYNTSFYRAYTLRYRVDTGWADSRKVIDTTNTNYSYPPELAVDQSGDVLAVWRQAPSASDSRTGLWENHFQ